MSQGGRPKRTNRRLPSPLVSGINCEILRANDGEFPPPLRGLIGCTDDDGHTRDIAMTTPEHFFNQHRRQTTRRWFFKECGVGLGTIALGSLLSDGKVHAASSSITGANPLAPRQPHFKAKAKRVIYLFMAGAPSHLELFDHKPELAKWDGKLPPAVGLLFIN